MSARVRAELDEIESLVRAGCERRAPPRRCHRGAAGDQLAL